RPAVPASITLGGGTVAVRVPAARSCLQLLQSLGEPVTGTSANVSGQPPARLAAEAQLALPGVDAVLAHDASIETGVASTVVDVSVEPPSITRIGAVSVDQVRATVSSRLHVPTLTGQ